jgi:hypothetical protein
MYLKLMLTEREIQASYADREGSTSLLKMHVQERSFELNAQGHFYRSTYDTLLAGKLKGFAYSEEEVEWTMASFSRFPLGSI